MDEAGALFAEGKAGDVYAWQLGHFNISGITPGADRPLSFPVSVGHGESSYCGRLHVRHRDLGECSGRGREAALALLKELYSTEVRKIVYGAALALHAHECGLFADGTRIRRPC